MLTYDEMPEDNDDLREVNVTFSTLADDSPSSCPTPLAEIVEYLQREGENVEFGRLRWLRTAQVAEKQYWMWRFTDEDEMECYVTVALHPDGTTEVGYDGNWHNLSPEQYLLGDYHNVF